MNKKKEKLTTKYVFYGAAPLYFRFLVHLYTIHRKIVENATHIPINRWRWHRKVPKISKCARDTFIALGEVLQPQVFWLLNLQEFAFLAMSNNQNLEFTKATWKKKLGEGLLRKSLYKVAVISRGKYNDGLCRACQLISINRIKNMHFKIRLYGLYSYI